jgi:hypothetical protein
MSALTLSRIIQREAEKLLKKSEAADSPLGEDDLDALVKLSNAQKALKDTAPQGRSQQNYSETDIEADLRLVQGT